MPTPVNKITDLYGRLQSLRVTLGDPRVVTLQFGTNTPLEPLKVATPSLRAIGLETNLGRPHIINVQDLVVKIPRTWVTYGALRLPVTIDGTTPARVVDINENKPLVYVVTIAVERDSG